jgi:hypothetical protein
MLLSSDFRKAHFQPPFVLHRMTWLLADGTLRPPSLSLSVLFAIQKLRMEAYYGRLHKIMGRDKKSATPSNLEYQLFDESGSEARKQSPT